MDRLLTTILVLALVLLVVLPFVIFNEPPEASDSNSIGTLHQAGKSTGDLKEVKEKENTDIGVNANVSAYLPLAQKESKDTSEVRTEKQTLPAVEIGMIGEIFNEDLPIETISIDPLVAFIVQQDPDFGRIGSASSYVSKDTFVPELLGLGPPCLAGERSWLTGYDYYSHSKHPAVDIACTKHHDRGPNNDYFRVAASTDALVYAVLTTEYEALQYGYSSGITVIIKARVENGYLYFGYGHMDVEGLAVTAGDYVKAGQFLGYISRKGTTGNTTGPHIHYFVIFEDLEGNMYYRNPNDYEAIGIRSTASGADIPLMGMLPEGFAAVHVAIEELPFIKIESEIVYVTDTSGNTLPSTVTRYTLVGNSCNDFSLEDGIALTYLMSKRYEMDFAVTGALIAAESGYVFFENRGGQCTVIQNHRGAPAYCAGQIWKPDGWGGTPLHARYKLYPSYEGDLRNLHNPVYCMMASFDILKSFGGSTVRAAAGYQGFSYNTNAPSFVGNFLRHYNAGAVTRNGVTYPFNNDLVIEGLLSSNLIKAQQMIDEFYSSYR
jgi:hypothetical protein